MKTFSLLLTALLLTGCSKYERLPNETLECSIDDTLVFVAYEVNPYWSVSTRGDAVLIAETKDGRIARRMQENETCVGRGK